MQIKVVTSMNMSMNLRILQCMPTADNPTVPAAGSRIAPSGKYVLEAWRLPR